MISRARWVFDCPNHRLRAAEGRAIALASGEVRTVAGRVVRVLPDQPAVGKTFDYLVPDDLGGEVRVGTRVRVPLGGRRVGGWIVEIDVEAPADVSLRPIAKLSGWGPPGELIDLAEWAAWRWAGRTASFLRTASPERVVQQLPPVPRGGLPSVGVADPSVREALKAGRAVLRQPPGADVTLAPLAASAVGNALVLCPTQALAAAVSRTLQRAGVPVARHPRDWAVGAAGATVVGTRAAAWAPVTNLAAVVVIDEHDEAHAQEQAPTWHARDVVIERAHRAGALCVLTTSCPSLEALSWGPVFAPNRRVERNGWPVVDVFDRRGDDPRTGLFSSRLVGVLRSERRIVCVLNRTGRARLLSCARCGELARCETCDAAVTQGADGRLVCPRCGQTRPPVCATCGATRLKVLRQGVSRAREELEALVGESVGEITGGSGSAPRATSQPRSGPDQRVIVGTEAALHQVERADVVVFLDLDQELLAPRYRAVEQAMALVVRAARLVGGKATGGRLVLQTRLPRHEVVLAALYGDPTRVSEAEGRRRKLLRFPPYAALAEISGPAADGFIAALGQPLGLEVLGPTDGRWLLRADDHRTLCDALAATPRPHGRLRITVDPLRI